MGTKQALIERLKKHAMDSRRNGSEAANERAYTYRVQSICMPENEVARSTYVIGSTYGYFKEDNCGTESAGTLSFVAEVTLTDPDYGSFPGWIYNSQLASPPRSYFFSKVETFPDELPGLYLLCKGKPYKAGDPVEYDVWDGLAATRS